MLNAGYKSHSQTQKLSHQVSSLYMDPATLLSDRLRHSHRPTLRSAALFLGTASSRRMMREPSMAVREAAAEQLEVRQSDWAYSKPVVLLDLVWNLAFIAMAAGVLAVSRDEKPKMPLRVWVVGYAAQCLAHIVCVCVEYRKRIGRRTGSGRNIGEFVPPTDLEEGSAGYDSEGNPFEERASISKHLESANTMFSFIWWIIGFYWVTVGGPSLTSDAPQLYWLCIAFLAFDVFFVVFCVALAFIIGIAVCCCLPCIIAILYAVADQEGASDEVIHQLPKYKFRRGGEISRSSGGIMSECGSDSPHEHVLSADDAECCICLSAYEDGVELRELPCSHHFHCTCIDKWLRINATCPLCKYNIVRNINRGSEEA